MTEHAKHDANRVVDDAARQERRDAVAAHLRGLDSYPFSIQTRLPGIHGAEYRPPQSYDPDQRWLARFGRRALSIIDMNNDLQVRVKPRHGPYTRLNPADIELIAIEHPRGDVMPLHGSAIPPVTTEEHDGLTLIRQPDTATQRRDRVEVARELYTVKGITAVRFYDAGDIVENDDGTQSIPTLDQAKSFDPNPRTILLSSAGNNTYVATSSFESQSTRTVTVRRPRDAGNEPVHRIEMLDLPQGATDHALFESHLARCYQVADEYSNPLERPMSPFLVDTILTYMMQD